MNDAIIMRILPIGPAMNFFSGFFAYKLYLVVCILYLFLKVYVVKIGLAQRNATIRNFDQKWLVVCCFSFFVINPNTFSINTYLLEYLPITADSFSSYQFFFKCVEVIFETLLLQHFSIVYSGLSQAETEVLLQYSTEIPQARKRGLSIVDAHLIVLSSTIAYMTASEIFDGLFNLLYLLLKG